MRRATNSNGAEVVHYFPDAGSSSLAFEERTRRTTRDGCYPGLQIRSARRHERRRADRAARRGVMEISQGDTLVALHCNMVARLRLRDDGGLGPLVADVAKGFVSAHISADGARGLSSFTSLAGQNVAHDGENAGIKGLRDRSYGQINFVDGFDFVAQPSRWSS